MLAMLRAAAFLIIVRYGSVTTDVCHCLGDDGSMNEDNSAESINKLESANWTKLTIQKDSSGSQMETLDGWTKLKVVVNETNEDEKKLAEANWTNLFAETSEKETSDTPERPSPSKDQPARQPAKDQPGRHPAKDQPAKQKPQIVDYEDDYDDYYDDYSTPPEVSIIQEGGNTDDPPPKVTEHYSTKSDDGKTIYNNLNIAPGGGNNNVYHITVQYAQSAKKRRRDEQARKVANDKREKALKARLKEKEESGKSKGKKKGRRMPYGKFGR